MKHRWLVLIAMGLVIALTAAPSTVAQGEGSVKLSLDECLRTALENNLDLVSARRDPEIAAQSIEQQRAAFDGVVSAGATFSKADGDETIVNNVVTSTEEGSSESDVWNADVSFSQELQYGGSYTATYDFDDIEASSRSIQAATGFLNISDFTQQTDGFTLSYEMPLLNGFGKETNTEQLLLARNGLEISREDLRLQALITAQSVEDAYWDLLARRRELQISRLALNRAEDLLELNKKKVDVGTLAPIEITEAEAGVAAQVEAVILAETAQENAEDVLLQLLAVNDGDPIWDGSVEPTDRPSFVPVDVDVEDALAVALEQRPEIITARQRLRDSALSERVAKRRTRHGLDLTTSVTPNQQDDVDRLVETVLPPGNPPSDTSTDGEDTNWNVGLRYTYKLRNRSEKAGYAIARLNTEKSDLAVRNTEQQIRVEIRRAVRNLESGIKRIEAARKNVELQQKKLEAEQKKFDNGMSTSFEVLTFQNDLADAELSEVRSRLEYVKSVTGLERAQGTLLEARGLAVSAN